MVYEDDVRARAQSFADALDRSDFDAVAAMLSPGCRFDLTGASFPSERTLAGVDAIVESYRWHDARARRLFDTVEYSNAVEAVDSNRAVIRFIDVLEKAGTTHTYSCRQQITLDGQLRIASIVQEDIPAEATALRAFMKRVGITL